MITFVKWNALFGLSLFLSLVLAAQVPPAAASGSEVELEAELSNSCSTCTAVPKLKGEAKFEEEFGSDGTTIKEAEIEAQVQIPIPNPLSIDTTNAGTASVVLELSNTDPNAPYATCALALKKASSNKASYRLKVQTKLSGATHVPGKKQIGSCTLDAIDLNVQAGDTAIITANGFDVLSGVFGGEEKEEDDD